MKLIPDSFKLIPGDSYAAGQFAEFYARMYLRLRGFKILESRYVTGKHTHRAEIDIIAKRGNLIVFIEVKKRASVDVALNAVTAPQAARLRRAAETYLARTQWRGDSRFDIITVCNGKINWVRGAI